MGSHYFRVMPPKAMLKGTLQPDQDLTRAQFHKHAELAAACASLKFALLAGALLALCAAGGMRLLRRGSAH